MRTLFLALCCVVGSACTLGTEPQRCDICTTSAVVYGTVRSTSALPVAGARISIEARQSSCLGTNINSFGDPVTTDALGNYRLTIISVFAPTAVCLVVAAQPLASSGLVAAGDTGHVIRLQPDYLAGQPRDSVRVDLLMRSTP